MSQKPDIKFVPPTRTNVPARRENKKTEKRDILSQTLQSSQSQRQVSGDSQSTRREREKKMKTTEERYIPKRKKIFTKDKSTQTEPK